MMCPHCQQPLDAGAAFCGNCGQAIATAIAGTNVTSGPAPVPYPVSAPGSGSGLPAQLAAAPSDHSARGTIALIVSFISIVTSIIPLIGVPVAVFGFIMAILGLRTSNRSLAIIAFIFLTLSLPLNVLAGYFGYTHRSSPKSHATAQVTTTNCFEATLDGSYVATSDAANCSTNAVSVEHGDNYVLKAIPTATHIGTPEKLATVSKLDLAYLAKKLVGLQIDGQGPTTFHDEPAYQATITYQNRHSIIMYVTHSADYAIGSGQANLFALIFESTRTTPHDLSSLDSGWSWK